MFLYCTCHNIRILYILFDGYEGVNFLQQATGTSLNVIVDFLLFLKLILLFSGEIFCCTIRCCLHESGLTFNPDRNVKSIRVYMEFCKHLIGFVLKWNEFIPD